MKASKQPVLATWVLEHIRFSNTNEALAGDLLEDFQHGRSVAWYWRQVLAAILVGFGTEVRQHWVLAVRAVVIGLAVNFAALVLSHEVLVKLYRERVLHPWFFPSLAAWIVESFFSGFVSGWTVALLHRKHRDAMLLTWSGALLVWASMLRGVLLTPRPFRQFLMESCTFYVSALAGVFIGGLLPATTRKSDAPRNEGPSPAC